MSLFNSQPTQSNFDVAIIGGGPAGLSAGVWLSRFLHDVVLIDAGDPRNWKTQEVHGVLGHKRIRPAKLRRRSQKQCRVYGTTLVDAHVDRVWQEGSDAFQLETDDGVTYDARRVLLTTGIRDNWPEIPGLEKCYGTTVHTCPNCDGYESRDSSTAVLGAGPTAASVALALTTWTRQLTICTNGHKPQFDVPSREALERLEIDILTDPISRLEQKRRRVQALRLDDGQSIECEHIFIAMGQHGRDDPGLQLGCDRTDRGFIQIDAQHHTSVRNVFAAGDVTPGAQLAIRAAAGGAEAALSIHHSLIPDYRRVHREC